MATPRFSIEIDGTRLPGALLGRVSALELTEADDQPARLALRIGLRQGADGTYDVLDDGPFEPGAEIRLTLAAPGGADQVMFSGYLSHLRPHFEEPEANSWLEVLAADAAMLMAAEERVASYPDAGDSDAAREIAGRYGLQVEAQDTDAKLAADDMLLIQRADDWSFLRHLAARNGFVTYLEPDPASGQPTCHFHPRDLGGQPQADLTILRENANLDWIDFAASLERPEKRLAHGIDAVAKRMVRADGEAQDELLGQALFAAEAAEGLARAGATGSVRFLRGTLPRDAAMGAHARGRGVRDHLAIEARGQLDPARYRGLLRAHRTALIKGVGDRLSGTWYIREVTTEMAEGMLVQRFSALTNALGRRGGEGFGQSAEEDPPA
ncbi:MULTISPECIES: hypothetical protein [Paracoccus]|uniref:hypothetical protein n=1 Tax=Paracoccus TaxID=265 RepID=UPI001FB61E0B|nr:MULTISPECIES: hypothetical protein [Paracoccus]MCJ1903134.1 hypothetical protein [Paracoccus versutus]MDF3904116.1 hypothetical protein [Paracoccus sp. AS002]